MHRTIEPTILYYFGTPVALISTLNLIRTRECVINLPSADLVSHVDRLALTTGKNPLPERKQEWGYRYESDKFAAAGLDPAASTLVARRASPSAPSRWKALFITTVRSARM